MQNHLTSLLLHFQNDALCAASQTMCSIWNGNPQAAYSLGNAAAQIIDAARIYDLEQPCWANEETTAEHFIAMLQRLRDSHCNKNNLKYLLQFCDTWIDKFQALIRPLTPDELAIECGSISPAGEPLSYPPTHELGADGLAMLYDIQ